MDTSKEYILMCEKAVEIQNVKFKHELVTTEDYIVCTTGEVQLADTTICEVDYDLSCKKLFIWLPRQDQLQRMVFDGYACLVDATINVCNWYIHNYAKRYCSLEQIWLAFVMKEKFNKFWTGEDWEKR